MKPRYPLDQCALYATGSKLRLSERLCRTQKFIVSRSHKLELYSCWDEKKASGGTRRIEAPRPDLKAIQKRIADLLQRVLPPSFLYSPVKGRSYVENALAHRGATEVRLLDVVNYFGNCSSIAVHSFFLNDLKCAPDVSWVLTGLTTREGHLPQGSPCSPILSFYCCKKMWEEIASVVSQAGCNVTVYVDDITISGDKITQSLIWKIKQILHKYGHSSHKKKERRHLNRAAEITGIMVSPKGVCVPHRHYKKLRAARIEAINATDDLAKSSFTARARSLESQVQRLRSLSTS